MSYSPNLDAYFARIGYQGSQTPTLSTLHAIAAAHVQAIPFESIDVILDRGISIDPSAIEDKLIHRQRGGYCFEQNTLLLHVLNHLGFHVTPLSARVLLSTPAEVIPPRTHLLLQVDIADEAWLVDVGIGSMSMAAAIQLRLDVELPTPHEHRRIVADGTWHGFDVRSPTARLRHQSQHKGDWSDVYEFTLEPMPEIDRIVANYYTSTYPNTQFRDSLMVAIATPSGRKTILNRTFKQRHNNSEEVNIIDSPAQLMEILAEHFNLRFSSDTKIQCSGLNWEDEPDMSK